MIPEPYYSLFMVTVVVALAVLALRAHARVGELQRVAVTEALHRANYAERKDAEIAKLQRTIADLSRDVQLREQQLADMTRRYSVASMQLDANKKAQSRPFPTEGY